MEEKRSLKYQRKRKQRSQIGKERKPVKILESREKTEYGK